MNTNCKNCDKPDCPHKASREVFDVYPMHLAVDSNSEWIAILNAMYAAERVCDSNTVNWRDRCLAAEAELLALREALPKWRKPSRLRWWLKTADGQILGLTDDRDPRWPVWSRDEDLGDAESFDAARRLVELHHGLPVCEVLP